MTPKLNSYILGVQMSRGLLAFIHSSAPADLHEEKGALRDRDRRDPGAKPGEGRGAASLPSSRRAEAAAGSSGQTKCQGPSSSLPL